MNTPSPSTADAAFKDAQALMRAGDFAGARAGLAGALETAPEHIDLLYALAVCERKLGQSMAALEALDRLAAAAPDYGHGFQERGFLLQSMGKQADAARAFDRAVTLNPGLHASWRVLAGTEGYARRDEAKAQLEWLTSLPPELVSVTSFLHQKKLHKAEQLCRQFLKRQPHHPEAMRLLAEIGSQFQIYDDAEYLLESCLEFEPNFIRARLDYATVLHKRQKFDKALGQAEIMHRADPTNPALEVSLANAQQAVGNFDQAIKTYRKALDSSPNFPSVHVSCGHALKTIGRTDEAVSAYRNAFKAQADYGDAYWSLANLKTYKFSADEVAEMRALEASAGISENDRAHICFAIGKALEDAGEFETSFEYYDRGNALKRKQVRYDRDQIERDFAYQKEHFDAAFFAARKGHGDPSPDPIFILGLPRAGSTLLEQILASHSKVDGTMELANIIATAHRLRGRQMQEDKLRYPSILAELGPDELAKLGAQYIAETAHHRQGAPFFIDKMPNNFRHIALIKLILPNAKIIDARRAPMACCFSGFKQLFAEGQEFTYGLEDIAHYYREYVDIMNHWDTALPGQILRVQNEDVIEDLETQVRAILEFCGLRFEEACLNFHETKRAVRTPSSEQVRQPIYRSGMDQWRSFEPFLGPLKQALGDKLAPT